MSPSDDRVAVPTNGHHPAMSDVEPSPARNGEPARPRPSRSTAVPARSSRPSRPASWRPASASSRPCPARARPAPRPARLRAATPHDVDRAARHQPARSGRGVRGPVRGRPAETPVRPIAGGTDLMVALTGELGPPPASVVDLWAIDDLRGIAIDGGSLALGALTTYTDIRRSALCREHVPALVEAAATIGAAQIQNRGTLGGNIANASPAGDTLPVLLAADAVFVVGSERGEREVPAAEFWTALPADGPRARRARPADPHPARRGPRDPLPQGRHAPRPVDQQGRAGRRVAGRRGRGATSVSPSGPWRPPRSARTERRPPSRAGRRRPRPPTGRPRRWPASWHPSTTSGRPPSTAASSLRASCTGSSARPAAGDPGRVTPDRATLATAVRGGAAVPRPARGRRPVRDDRPALPRRP